MTLPFAPRRRFLALLLLLSLFLRAPTSLSFAFLQPRLQSSSSTTLSSLFAKNNKKKKKKATPTHPVLPTPSANSPPSANPPPTPTPQRITSETAPGLTMRQQLKLVKARDDYIAPKTTIVSKKKQFHKKATTDDLEQARIERAENAKLALANVGRGSSPLLVVDGYNIINKYPRLKKRLTRGDLWQARVMLNTQLEELAGIRGWRVKVVYDGGENRGKVEEEIHSGGAKLKAEGSTNVVEVVFSPLGVEADTLIERLSFENGRDNENENNKHLGKFLVCSDDRMIQIAAQNNGGMVISAGLLVDELKAARKATMGVAAIATARAAGAISNKRGWRIEDNIDLTEIKAELKRRADKAAEAASAAAAVVVKAENEEDES
ncbi:hypothetical protein TL16_g10121 [Triparma laevis f. inornata]|uniref:Uncharacterized protein n=1 Tax=Triparma laevis f. inornata TaxID=1714386 RepID=A0A9W7B749_9STRA|nr:hypothetical protein TL16_g10121 [Triparma laevis f. inornata]